jgi:hypothetical protein
MLIAVCLSCERMAAEREREEDALAATQTGVPKKACACGASSLAPECGLCLEEYDRGS